MLLSGGIDNWIELAFSLRSLIYNFSVTTSELSSAQCSAIHQATADAKGLPAKSYTSTEWMRSERDKVFSPTWTAIGYVHDLPLASATPVDLMGLPLLMVKDLIGTVRVFHNVCRHRGRQLVDEPCVLRGSIRCPYHNWTYNFDGSLSGTPHIGGYGIHHLDNFDSALHGLFSVRSAVWMDMLFVNFSADASSFEEHIAPLETRWSKFTGKRNLSSAKPVNDGGWMEMEVRANWKLAVENYCESYHLPWVHPDLNRYSRIEDHYSILAGDWGAGQGTTVFDFSERAGIDLPVFANWPETEKKVAEYIALFPNVLLGLQIDHFFSVILLPVAVDRTVEQLQIYYVGDETLTERYAKARRVLLEGWREVFVEDINPVEGMQRGRASTAFDGGAFSSVLDTGTHHFHKWVASRLAEN